KKAKAGIIKGYTGVDAPYEEPESPDLIIESDKLSPEESAEKVYKFLIEKGWVPTF
ncbi:MAG: adenylyl-sulfate kinase, partial [Thermodesulfobacterium sp.]|nr:adenylyl-sulfate kinase [Thermodesulfobacterium sp.]